jgi:hypothetical protein
MTEPRLRLVDRPGEQGRTTVTLLASLAARLATLTATSGSDAVGSMTAGYAALGRVASRTAEGARLRDAIERSRAGANGEAIWRELKMDTWASSLPPAAVLDQLTNDLALLAADDLEDALVLPLAPAEPYGADEAPRPERAEFADYLLGMWLFGRSVASAIEGLLADELARAPIVVSATQPVAGDPPGSLLR